MTVSLCVASRGRPELLGATVRETLSHVVMADTRISVALDDDDQESVWAASSIVDPRVLVSVAEREDSLGAKYNRASRAHRASLYVGGCDDTAIVTPGWDEKLLAASRIFGDDIAVVYFGQIPGVFQPGCAVTQGLVDSMGYFMAPYFPFWWHDTWLDEIGHMIGRIVKTDVDIEARGDIGQTRGAREIAYWAKFFDDTRPWRREIAEKIIAERLDTLESAFLERNAFLRNPDNAGRLENTSSFDAPADERYQRIRAAAERLVA